MVEDLFTPQAVEALRPQVKHVVDSLLDTIIAKGCKSGPVDLVQDFAALVNPKVIFSLFGIAERDADELARSSASLGGTSGTALDSGPTMLHDYLSRLVDQRIEKTPSPPTDVISKLAEQHKAGNLDREDITNLAFMIFIAGNSAIISSIGLGILTLAQHPQQLDDIRKKPELIKQAVEEILRYHTPSALNSRRVAKEDVKLGGQVSQSVVSGAI